MPNLKPWIYESYKEVVQALKLGRLPSALIISGDRGLKTDKLALEIAKVYLCRNRHDGLPCETCPSCRLFSHDFSQDSEGSSVSIADFLAVLSTSKEQFDKELDLSHRPLDLVQNISKGNAVSLRIDTLRRFQDWVMESSMGNNGKVAIISNAHLMQTSAQNAILKTFEEPPKDTLIIMLTNSLSALLPTILSRAYKLNIPYPDISTGILELENLNIDKEKAALALALNSYIPDDSYKMIVDGKFEHAMKIFNALVKSLSINKDSSEFISLIFEQNKETKAPILSLDEIRSLLQVFISSLLKYKAHVDIVYLPLLVALDCTALARIKAEKLFLAHQMLSNLQLGLNRTPLRAPQAFFRDLVENLNSRT